MRAVIIRTFGDPSGMEVTDLPVPTPGAGCVLVRTEAVGVGGVDVVIRRGGIAEAARDSGMIPGSEAAGVITATGPDVDPAWVGRRVWAFTGTSGAYAEYVIARADEIVDLPSDLTSVQAVTLGSAFPVAHFALERARLAEGESVLVRGAAGSIGLAGVELAARAGAGVIAVTTSSSERGERLRAFGAAHVLDRSGAGDADAPAKFDVILDVVGGPDLPRFIERLSPNGRLIAVGVVGGFPPADFGTALLAGFRRSITFGTLSLDTVPRAELARVRTEVFDDAVRGTLSPVVHDTLPLSDAAEAHRLMDAGDVFGRIVLVP
ncbi:NADPH:quinone reductase [Plantibacter flavus]|uniref:NADPH:quinone reductase-like Zn-dependent oxidoreductase n=1 Tax=Plantibacter flavus TaxID=150123 RepID=A0A3N2C3P2_9MICO|nr:zinc-binding dehydrogenase [Plantibacter flavus]ROR82093.1 NADPH:quinone reductase-like Zn-dependent oxidoreductase [Plantibacter flavus]SMG51333.1 NADPH:quinone reductase [Plantibacter flavus]